MLDFTSALYLGLRHPSQSLRPWSQLTTGRPAALATRADQARVVQVAQALARLKGCEQALLGPSTLHLFWDLFAQLSRDRVAIYLDAGSYPIMRWGTTQAAVQGVRVRRFPHHDTATLRRLLTQERARDVRPVVAADGFCPGCGKSVPIAAYLENLRPYGGYLVLDDTQALGILGHSPSAIMPYGRGGGGSLRWRHIADPHVLVVSSLAKGFGVPIAVLAGCNDLVRWFEARSETRVHCSPPAAAAIHATEHALRVNSRQGDALRQRLAQLVSRFHNHLTTAGLAASGGLFPVQTLVPIPGLAAETLHERLLRAGVRTVLHHARNGYGARISFLMTARHDSADIDNAAKILAHITRATLATVSGVNHEEPTRYYSRAL